MTELRRAEVWVNSRHAGSLLETDNGHVFQYAEEYVQDGDAVPVSLTLPLSEKLHRSQGMFPFFDGIIPEGWLLHVASRNWKISPKDRFGLLKTVCRDVVGNVSVGETAPPPGSVTTLADEDFCPADAAVPPANAGICLHCGRPLSSAAEKETGWHRRCVQRFFGTTVLPTVSIDNRHFELAAIRAVSGRATVAGVQKKLSLHLLSDPEHPRLTLVDQPSGYIVKPQEDRFSSMPEAEHLVMSMADACGISTVPHALIASAGGYVYITKRVDRRLGTPNKRAMEDFAQLGNRLTENKYSGSCERCARILSRYSSQPMLDMSELYMRLVFAFLTGNSDMHLKNYSLIENIPGSGQYSLSPAYDLLPVQVLLPEDNEESALALNGRKTNLRRKDFFAFAEKAGLSEKAAQKMLSKQLSKVPELLRMADASFLPIDLQERLKRLIVQRRKF